MTRRFKTLRSCFLLFCVAVILAFTSTASAQWNEQVLYSFQGLPDGAVPVGGIVFGEIGSLYGATTDGGSSACAGVAECGTVFQLAPPAKQGDPWTETVLYVFRGRAQNDGATPGGGLVMDASGNLYGTTSYDGTGLCRLLGSVVGCGTVYELSPPAQPGGAWTEKVLYSFQGGNDGNVPVGDLVFDKAGNLYGATLFGGGKGTNCNNLYGYCGTIFELSPPKASVSGRWTEKVLYSFEGIGPGGTIGDGGNPNGGLVLDETGTVYGTTYYGGGGTAICRPQGCGTAFELLPPKHEGGTWTEKVLHRFQNRPSDGAGPNAGLVLVNGTLYGTTAGGGNHEDGVVFELQPPAGGNGSWVEGLIHVFTGGSDGGGPTSLILGPDGIFYGSADGGSLSRGGLIFQMQPPVEKGGVWNFVTEYNFGGPPNGYDPMDLRLVKGRNNMYGSTLYGGTGQACNGGCGTVFEVTP